MDVKSTFILTFLHLGQLYAVMHKSSVVDLSCCNGTLGYAAYQDKMPCSTMTCCNESETVVAFPINAALGYGFRCMAITSLTKDCYKNGEVFSTNDTALVYEDRHCCRGSKFDLVFHKPGGAALSINCVTSTL